MTSLPGCMREVTQRGLCFSNGEKMVFRPMPDNASTGTASNAIHSHINDILVCSGLRGGVSEADLPCFTTVSAEIALMSGSAFTVTHHAFSS